MSFWAKSTSKATRKLSSTLLETLSQPVSLPPKTWSGKFKSDIAIKIHVGSILCLQAHSPNYYLPKSNDSVIFILAKQVASDWAFLVWNFAVKLGSNLVNVETSMRPSSRSRLTPFRSRAPITTKMTVARRPSYSSLFSATPTSKTTWRSSTKSARRTKRLRPRFKKILRNKKPTEIKRRPTPRMAATRKSQWGPEPNWPERDPRWNGMTLSRFDFDRIAGYTSWR